MALNRGVTNRVNWVLDNCLPPIVRDAPVLMRPLMRLVLGPLYADYVRFKEQAAGMSAAEYRAVYRRLHETFLPRETDLSAGCVAAIRRCSMRDAGAGT